MIPLLNIDPLRILTLHAFTTLSHHGGIDVHTELAKETSTFTELMEKYPDDAKTNELIVCTLSHATGSTICEDAVPLHMKSAIDEPLIIKLIVEAMLKPNPPYYLLNHGLNFFMATSLYYRKEMLAMPSLMDLLVACLRCNDISVRCDAWITIMRIGTYGAERDVRAFDPFMMMSLGRKKLPPHLEEPCKRYGEDKVERYLTTQTLTECNEAVSQCNKDHDLCKLGLKLAELITRTEYSTGGLGFMLSDDILHECAKVLREKGFFDEADILDVKYWISNSDIDKAANVAESAIRRNPHVAYYYYAVGLHANSERALRAVKKGLKAKQTTPFVRHYLLWRAVDHSSKLGVLRLTSDHMCSPTWEEGVALLTNAYEDAKTFMLEAPPDAKHMMGMTNWYMILGVVLHGPEYSAELKELLVRPP